MFHSFHDILASSDGDSISIWSLETSSRILNIPKKTNSHRGNVRSRPPSAPAFSTNQSNASLNGLYMSATADNQTGAATSATQLAGSYGQQNLSNPAGASGGRVGRSSPDIAPVVASTLAGTPSSTITTMSWINESYDALLLVGSDDGNVKIWRDTADSDVHASYTANVTGQGNFVSASRDTGAMGRSTGGNSGPSNGSSDAIGISLASSFTALPDIADTSSGSGLVTSWLQHSGTLVVGGNSSSIHVWDLSREQCVRTFSTGLKYFLYLSYYFNSFTF